jgi:prephenate dehydrogenase
MATISLSILGLDRLGASVGLALRRYNLRKNSSHVFKTVGFDTRPGVTEAAEKLAVAGNIAVADKIARRLGEAVEGQDIVVLTLPYSEVKDTYSRMAAGLRAGAVVLDMSPLIQPSLEWAAKYLPEGVHMVGITPVVNPDYLFDGLDDTEHAHDDLFDRGTLMLMPNPNCAKEAVELAVDFASVLGATPHFLDPAEHDGLMAYTEGLPALLGILAFRAISKSRGWTDGQRLTNPNVGRLTHHLFDTHPDDVRDLLLNNRENTMRALDDLIATLGDVRALLADNNRHALEAALIEASQEYEAWINRRTNGRWDDSGAVDMPSTGSIMMRGLLGGNVSKWLGKGQDKDKE